MVHINDFPVELLARIFQFVAKSGTAIYYDKSRNQFPFNVGNACMLWMNILQTTPRYWRDLTFDVADDPTPLLNTIGLYDREGFRIHVISSGTELRSEDCTNAQKLQEYSRARTIFFHLEPHLATCEVIKFDLMYQSSLPSCADILTHHLPCLSVLSLHCHKHDLDNNNLAIELDAGKISSLKNLPPPYCPSLDELSLTGYSFMQLSQLGAEWIQAFSQSILENLDLNVTIKHFQFHKHGHWDYNGGRTLNAFIDTLACWSVSAPFQLSLSDMSINYRPTLRSTRFAIPLMGMKMENVSRDFIGAFFSSVTRAEFEEPLHSIHFEGCSIPPMISDASMAPNFIALDHTPLRKTNSTPALDDSVYNIVSAFQPRALLLRECKGLSDAFFDWLCGEDDNVEAKQLARLDIETCAGFTAKGLRNFIQERNKRSERYGSNVISPITYVYVEGDQRALLSKDDRRWFRSVKDEVEVDWSVRYRDEKTGENIFKSFKTSS